MRRLMLHRQLEQYQLSTLVTNYPQSPKLSQSPTAVMSHKKCGHHYRVGMYESLDTNEMMWALEEAGEHCGPETNRVQSGIHPAIRKTVDAMARGGAGPKKILKQLALAYSSNDVLKNKIPKASQVKSRKSFLLQELEKGWKIKTFTDMCEWCNPRLCNTNEAFFGPAGFQTESDEKSFQAASFEFQNAPIVWDTFTHTYPEEGKTKESFGVVLTSRRVFRNVFYAAEGQQSDGIFAAANGTYRLHHGNWTVVAFDTYRLRYTRGKYSKNFVPWAYMFVHSENEFAYEMLFRTVAQFAHEFFGVRLNVKYGSLDHSASIANAYVAVWPNIVLLDCYAHVARKCREKSGYYARRAFTTPTLQSIFSKCTARDPLSSLQLSRKKCVAYWRKENEVEYSAWFEKIYLGERWSRWYTTCAMPGVLPSQNALESHNGVIKTCGVTSKKIKTGVVLNDSIPGVLAIAAQDVATTAFGHICTGPLLSAVVSFVHVAEGAHYDYTWIENGKVINRSMWFNSSKYRQKPDEPPSHRVTETRVNRYLKGKAGEITKNCKVEDITLMYQSLHEVEFLKPAEQHTALMLKLEPEIQLVTVNSDWLRSYPFYLQPKRVVGNAKAKVLCTRIRPAVRPYQRVSSAQTSREPAARRLVASSRGVDITVNGKKTRELIPGIIKGFSYGKRYKWRVKFSDGDQMYFECEELVEMIISSSKQGLDVTNSSTAAKYHRCVCNCEGNNEDVGRECGPAAGVAEPLATGDTEP